MALFPGLPNGSPKIGTIIVLKFWMFICSSKQAFLEHTRVISYNLQKYAFKSVLHTPIGDHLTLVLRDFVVKHLDPMAYIHGQKYHHHRDYKGHMWTVGLLCRFIIPNLIDETS